MTVNEESRQIAIAKQLAETAKQLAHSTKAIPKPFDSYALFGNLVSAQESLADVYAQLAAWHRRVVDGVHYDGEDNRDHTDAPAAVSAADSLEQAAGMARSAVDQLRQGHSFNGVIRWHDDIDETNQT